jgi:hypothetical protein
MSWQLKVPDLVLTLRDLGETLHAGHFGSAVKIRGTPR